MPLMDIYNTVDSIIRVSGPRTIGCTTHKKDCFLSISDLSVSKIHEVYLNKEQMEELIRDLNTAYKEVCDKED